MLREKPPSCSTCSSYLGAELKGELNPDRLHLDSRRIRMPTIAVNIRGALRYSGLAIRRLAEHPEFESVHLESRRSAPEG